MSEIETEYTRVTEALGYFKTEGFFKWKKRVGEREANAIAKRAGIIGTRIDEIIRSGIYKCDSKDLLRTKNCLAAFLKWKERYQVETIISMERLTDEGIGLTGEPDVFWVEDKRLIDIKGTKAIWADHFFQLGGYLRLGVQADGVAILRLDPETADFEYITNEKIGLTKEQIIDAYEAAYKKYKYYRYVEEKIK